MKKRATLAVIVALTCAGDARSATVAQRPHDHAPGPVTARVDPAVMEMVVALDRGPDGGLATQMRQAFRASGTPMRDDRGMVELMAGLEGTPAPGRGTLLDVPEQGWDATVAHVSGGLRGGAHCTMDAPGTVEVIGTDPEFGVLLLYSPGHAPHRRHAVEEEVDGPFCEKGVLAFVDRLTVAGWHEHSDDAARDRARAARREDAASRILDHAAGAEHP